MKAQITVNMDNAAFVDDGNDGKTELARVLRKLADQLDNGSDGAPLYDTNGNNVGRFDIAD